MRRSVMPENTNDVARRIRSSVLFDFMSYTELIIFKDGKADGGVEYRNAWGGSARIWNALFAAHVPKKYEYDSWLANNGNDQRLWDLATRTDLPMFERAVHSFTFDHFYVRKENFGRLAADLRSFVAKYPAGEAVDHLPAWAQWLDENRDKEAVGLYGTSVAKNVWYRAKTCPHCGNSTDETEPVPLSEGTEVYEWLEADKSNREVREPAT
jgi:DNA primase